MQSRFTKKAEEALQSAGIMAAQLGHSYIGSEHILIGLVSVEDSLACAILTKYGVERERLIELVNQLIAPDRELNVKEPEGYTPRARRIIENATKEAIRFKANLIGTEHILIAIIKESDSVAARLLNTIGVNIKRLYVDLMVAMGEDANHYKEDFQNGKPRSKDSVTATLDQYSRDLTQFAAEGKLDPVIGREQEIQRVMQILSRRTKNNPCLIGEPGVGKTAIAEGLALRIVSGNVPDTIKDKRLVTLDLSGMVAGSKYRGEFEERIKKVIAEVRQAGNVLLFLDELHTIIGAGGAEGAIDASNILKPSLARGEIQLIGATTLDEYRKHIEKDAALERRFQPVRVEEPSEEETIAILKGLRGKYEEHHKVTITDEALEAAVKFSKRYINDRFLPDKAIDLIDEASSRIRLNTFNMPESVKKLEEEIHQLETAKEEAIKSEAYEQAGEIKKKQSKKQDKLRKMKEDWETQKNNTQLAVGEDEIADVVSMWTKIPVRKLAIAESERLMKLEETLHRRVIGQEEAVTSIAKAIRRGRVGLKDPKRPIGSFLFLGPTGVGKTELSKTLADAMFGSENALIRVDMSEYMESHSTSKLIGSPPGYVGYDDAGQLTEKVRRKPYSIVLLDEIEKAHPDVFNILLQVLDDGRLTDAQGNTVNFENTIIIMTSNAGSTSTNSIGFGNAEANKNKVLNSLKETFRPEFLNRVDEIVVFDSLDKTQLLQIVNLMLEDTKKILSEKDILLHISESAKEFLLQKGTDMKYGARPLRRAIQRYIEDEISEMILRTQIVNGQKIEVDHTASQEHLTFQILS